jgi:hypothetical protein
MCASCIICTIAGILGPFGGVFRSMLMIFLVKNMTFCARSDAQANTYITVTLYFTDWRRKVKESNLVKNKSEKL